MTFASPSHAWALWLDRDSDIALAADNASTVRAALDALASGDRRRAQQLWTSVNGQQLLEAWNAQVVVMRDKARWPSSLFSRPDRIGPKPTKRLARPLSTRVFERDGYLCGYCGIPVVTQWKDGDIVQLVQAFPDATKQLSIEDGSLRGSGKSGALKNCDVAKWLWITAVADHIFPAALGGPTELHNLITSCAGCNYSKADWTLEQLGVRQPAVPTNR